MRKSKNVSTKDTQSGYERYLRSLRLLGLGLESCSARVEREPYFAISEKREGVRQIEARYDLTGVGDNYFESAARFKLTIAPEKAKTPALQIECTFSAHFHVPAGVKEFAKRFTDSEFRVVVWPYFRQFVSDITARMTVPPVLVPFASPAQLKK